MSDNVRLTVLIPAEMCKVMSSLLEPAGIKNDFQRETLPKFLRKALLTEIKQRSQSAKHVQNGAREIESPEDEGVRLAARAVHSSASLPHRADMSRQQVELTEEQRAGIPQFLQR